MQETQIFFLFMAIFLTADIVYGAYIWRQVKSFLRNATGVKATVTDVEEIKNRKDSYLNLSIIFRDQYGKDVSAKIRGIGITQCKKGDSVDILFLKSDPQQIKINNWMSLHAMSTICLIILPGMYLFVSCFMIYSGIIKWPF